MLLHDGQRGSQKLPFVTNGHAGAGLAQIDAQDNHSASVWKVYCMGGLLQLFRQMGHVVDGLPAKNAALRLQDAHAGVAENSAFPQPLNRTIDDAGIEILNKAPMGDHSCHLSRVFLHNALDGLPNPFIDLGHGLPAGEHAQVRGVVPVVGKLGVFLRDFGKGLILDFPYIHLQQALILADGQAVEFVHRLRRAVGPDKRAGVDGVQMLVAKAQGQQFQLLLPRPR